MAFQFTDEQVFQWMKKSVEKYQSLYDENQKDALKTFNKNPDPFHLITKMVALNLNKEEILNPIPVKASDDSYLMFQGEQWENLVLLNEDWEKPDRLLDVSRKDKSIIVEFKNKHNTVKGSDKVKNYDQMKACIDQDGYLLALFVFIVPKGLKQTHKPFTPSDNITKTKRPENSKILEVDGQTFFNKYFFQVENGFSLFINQLINISENFSDIFKDTKNLEFLKATRKIYGI
jgi:hypothetical protein